MALLSPLPGRWCGVLTRSWSGTAVALLLRGGGRGVLTPRPRHDLVNPLHKEQPNIDLCFICFNLSYIVIEMQ